MTYSVNITADAVAWYGAIVATISLIFSGITLWLDKGKIKISHSQSWVHAPGYNPDELHFDIQVRNVGRRTVVLGNVGIKLFDGSALLLAAGFDKRINKVLTEQNPRVNFLTPVSQIDFTKAHYIVIYDEKGKEYRRYLSRFPTFKKWFWRLRN